MFHAPHVPHQSAVGGTLPGYAGHRPAAMNTHGESAWGGVPQRIDDHAVPGQGMALPRTTAFEEVGQGFKPHEHNRTEQFRSAVGGIKVGYGGHVPGEKNHFGSNHQGQLPRVEYEQRSDLYERAVSPGPSRRGPSPGPDDGLEGHERRERWVPGAASEEGNGEDDEVLEARGVSPSPLMQPDEAVGLVRRGDRSAGAVSHGWCADSPLPPRAHRSSARCCCA